MDYVLFDLGSRSSRLTAAQSQGDDLYLYDKPPKPPAMPCRWFLICGYRIAGRAGPNGHDGQTGATNQRKGSRITLQGYLSSKTTSLQRLPLFKGCLQSLKATLWKLKARPAKTHLRAVTKVHLLLYAPEVAIPDQSILILGQAPPATSWLGTPRRIRCGERRRKWPGGHAALESVRLSPVFWRFIWLLRCGNAFCSSFLQS